MHNSEELCTLAFHIFESSFLFCSLGTHPDCIPSIMVPRNTAWKVRVMTSLKINCTVDTESHCRKNVDVSWCRIDNKSECRSLKHSDHITTEQRSITESKVMLFLIFQNISMQDAGLYRCEIKSLTPTVSHAINVTVTGNDIILIYTIYSFKYVFKCFRTHTHTLFKMYLPTTGK